MKYTAFFFLLYISFVSTAQKTTIIINDLPANHSFEEAIFLAGNLNNWNPSDDTYRLTLNEDQTYSISLEGSGNVEFKFTRGSWETVEKGRGCSEIANRSFSFDTDTLYEASIINWADICSAGSGTHSTTENVSILDEAFYMPQFDRNRRVWIYLPASYANSDESYPVLYMHDGQNLFDTFTSFSGEWQVDESLDQLIEKGAQASIVVGVDNGGANRIDEYTPWSNANYGGGDGAKYIDFIVETLKPYIDENYRTLPDRENTGIMGSSLGGLISFYAGLTEQAVFSKIGIFSPSFWFSDSSFVLARETEKEFPMQLYFVAGGQEGENNEVVVACGQMMDTLRGSGFSDSEMKLMAAPDGQHSEWFWRREFPSAYRWFWGIETIKVAKQLQQFEVYPNPATDSITIQLSNKDSKGQIRIFNTLGEIVYQTIGVKDQTVLSTNTLPDGNYIVQFQSDLIQLSRKLVIHN